MNMNIFPSLHGAMNRVTLSLARSKKPRDGAKMSSIYMKKSVRPRKTIQKCFDLHCSKPIGVLLKRQ